MEDHPPAEWRASVNSPTVQLGVSRAAPRGLSARPAKAPTLPKAGSWRARFWLIPAILVRFSRYSARVGWDALQRQGWQIVQSQLTLDDSLP